MCLAFLHWFWYSDAFTAIVEIFQAQQKMKALQLKTAQTVTDMTADG